MLYHIAYSHERGSGWIAMNLPRGIHTVEELERVQARIRAEMRVESAIVLAWRPFDGQEGA